MQTLDLSALVEDERTLPVDTESREDALNKLLIERIENRPEAYGMQKITRGVAATLFAPLQFVGSMLDCGNFPYDKRLTSASGIPVPEIFQTLREAGVISSDHTEGHAQIVKAFDNNRIPVGGFLQYRTRLLTLPDGSEAIRAYRDDMGSD